MRKKVVIIGAGISGLSLAKMLSDNFDVLILEKGIKAGGLIQCDRIDGNLFHKVGGHVFNSKNPLVLEWFWKNFDRDKEFLETKRNAKILLDSNLIGYPIENHIYQLPEKQVRVIISELAEILQKGDRALSSYDNFKDFLRGTFGERLYNLYFGPYNSKIWNTDLSEIPLNWLEGKLPMPAIPEIILSNILRKEESNLVHASFYYPKNNGSQFIIDRLSKDLTIHCSKPVSKIQLSSNAELVLNNGEIKADAIVYCGDIRKLSSLITIDDKNLKANLQSVNQLLSNGTSNALCETDEMDMSWLYLPEPRFKAHRIIYTGNFSPSNNKSAGRKTCVVEFSGNVNEQEIIKELEYLPGNLKPLAFNYEPNSYVIQHNDSRLQVNKLKENLSKYNIHLLGRFAEWEYYNMDKCIEAAMDLNGKLIDLL